MAKKADIKLLFGRRLRHLRETLGVSQEDFANTNQIGRSYYARCERGEVNVCLENIARFAEGLGVEPRDLFIF